jgi:hypothetical protein
MTNSTLSSNSRRDTVLALKKNLEKEGHPSCSDEGEKKVNDMYQGGKKG